MTTSNKMVIGILAAVVIVAGIGYAAISGQVLNITGTLSAAATDSDFNVKFTKAEKASGNDGTVTATIDGEKAATFSVSGLRVKGERAEATYTIKNESAEGIAANIETTLTATNEAYFDVTVEGPEKAIINPGEETTVTIIAELIKTPITAQTSNVTVQLEATPEEEKEVSLRTFKIDGVEYQAEEGMSWGKWTLSNYNTKFDNTKYLVDDIGQICFVSFDGQVFSAEVWGTCYPESWVISYNESPIWICDLCNDESCRYFIFYEEEMTFQEFVDAGWTVVYR